MTYKVFFSTEYDYPLFNLALGSVKPIKEGYNVFSLFAVYPIILLMIRCRCI